MTAYHDLQRRLTEMFIDADPTSVVLVPTVTTKSANGGQLKQDGTPRTSQTFKLSSLNPANRPTVVSDGRERVADYAMIGRYDATIAVGDHWTMPDGRRAEVIMMQEGFGYMTKVLVEAHG